MINPTFVYNEPVKFAGEEYVAITTKIKNVDIFGGANSEHIICLLSHMKWVKGYFKNYRSIDGTPLNTGNSIALGQRADFVLKTYRDDLGNPAPTVICKDRAVGGYGNNLRRLMLIRAFNKIADKGFSIIGPFSIPVELPTLTAMK
jgi:hypothetical protein